MKTKCFKVVWDNGANASGEFPMEFDSFADAKEFGDNWVKEITEVDPDLEDTEEGYTYEIVKYFEDGTYEYMEEDDA